MSWLRSADALSVRCSTDNRDSPSKYVCQSPGERIRTGSANFPVAKAGGKPVPLSELADITLEQTPPTVEHDNGRRRTFVSANVRGRDIASFVSEAQRTVSEQVELPPNYELTWGGDFESLQSASRRLLLITPIVLLVIFLLLHTSFGSTRLAALIFLCVPMAASGGVFALLLRGMPFSIAAGVGFIALFGVAVLNGLVWVSEAENHRKAGEDTRECGARRRQRSTTPCLDDRHGCQSGVPTDGSIDK